jgi:ABC-type antimicrobial peptide transport system permease subunit
MVMGDAMAGGSSESFFFAESGLHTQVRDVTSAFELVAGQVMTSGWNEVLTPRVMFETTDRPPETIGVTSEYFGVLGLTIRGRDFTADDDRPGAAAVAVISDRLWRDAFDARADVIGRVVPATPFPIQVIGVAPPDFHGARLGEDVDLWVPRNLVPRLGGLPPRPDGSGPTPMLAIARLRPSVTPVDAQRLMAEHSSRRPGPGMGSRLAVIPLSMIYGSPDHRTLVINEGPVVRIIGATALLVLFGGCATLMALVLVHYERRRQEFAVRLALGASRARLVTRLSAELVWILLFGCAGAVLAARWGIGVMPALDLPAGVNLARLDLTLDWRVAAAALAASFAALGAAALVPLVRFTRADVARALITPIATADVRSLRLRKVMLAVHVAATVVVVVAAALFVRTVQSGFAGGAGFDADATVFASVDVGSPYALSVVMAAERARGIPAPRDADERRHENARLGRAIADERQRVADRVLAALGGWPEIGRLAVGAAPLGPDQATQIVQPRGFQTAAGLQQLRAGRLWVSPGYIEALGLRIVGGRALTPADAHAATGPRPVVVNASLAAALLPDRPAVGERLRSGNADYVIVGIVSDFAYGSMRFDPPAVVMTTSRAEDPVPNTLHLVISSGNAAALADRVRRRLAEVVPDAPRLSVATGRELIAADLGRERLGAWFFSGFGLVALALAVGGVFGLVAYLAESRRRESGIRIALGATPWNITRVALSAALVPTLAGALAGLVGAAWLERAASSFLVTLGRFDVFSYVAALLLMVCLSTAAGLGAAWRVRRISPMDALRSE